MEEFFLAVLKSTNPNKPNNRNRTNDKKKSNRPNQPNNPSKFKSQPTRTEPDYAGTRGASREIAAVYKSYWVCG